MTESTHTTRRVTYRGHPSGAPMLAEMLKREGVKVKWERPREQRGGIGEMAQEVVVQMVATGGVAAIATAIAKFRKLIHDRGEEATVEDEHDDDLGE